MFQFSEEEENYLKLIGFVNNIATPALRVKFNQYFPPHLLPTILKNGEPKLRALRVLNVMQLDLLFPTSGAPVSENFDITLMVCLLRNLTNIAPPVNGFNVLPQIQETNEGGDIARIKWYRNLLFHKSKLSTHDYNDIWSDLTAAVVRFSPALKIHCDRLKSKKLTTECPCYDLHQEEIASWEDMDKCFVPTSAVNYISDQLQTKNSITVTGLAGVGKSVTIHHVALTLRDTEDYIIVPCRNPSDIPMHFRKGEKIVFVVDDICGKYTIHQNDVREWQKYLSEELTILSSGDIKILSSNRSSVFQDPSFRRLKVFSENACNLSLGIHCISVEEKKNIAMKYLPQDVLKKIQDEIGQMDYFPLLCQQYTTRPITDPLRFFNNPFDIFEQELSAMREEDKLKYCALLVCVLLNGCIRKADMRYEKYLRFDYDVIDDKGVDKTEIYGTHNKLSRNDMQTIFDLCELSLETPTSLIFRQYDCLLNTYMLKTENNYHCIHDSVFEFLIYYFGKHLQKEVISYCDSEIIRDHTYILSLNENHDTFSVLIEKDNETLYFLRIIKDISHGRIYDVFCNKQMQFRSYRSKFINFLQEDPQLGLDKLFLIKDDVRADGTDPVSSLYVVCSKGYVDLAEFILDSTGNVFDRSFNPLNAAASSGHCDLLEMMISRGADVNYRDESGQTPMTMACIGKHESAVELLIKKGSDLNKRTNKGPTPLMWTCSTGNKRIAELLLINGADIDRSDYEGKTPIMWSRKRSDDTMLDFLIYKGANLNKGDNHAWTSLMWTCFYGLTNIVDILILNGANINQANNEGLTSFMIACKGGKLDIVKLLLTKGVDTTIQDTFGRTAFMLACTEGQNDIVNVLIKSNVNIDCQDDYGVTPLIELCSQGQLILATTLIQNHACFNKTDNEGWTPLMACCLSNNYNLIKFLVHHGSDLNVSNKNGETALLIVCKGVIDRTIALCLDTGVYTKPYANFNKGDPKYIKAALKIVKYLLSKGANVAKLDNDGWSPLMWACKNNYIEIAKLLIENGSNMNQVSSDGKSILQRALLEERHDVLKLLVFNNINESKELNQAIKNNDMGTIEFLIDDEKRSCLQMNKDTLSLCQRNIIGKGINLINKFDDEGITPLLTSCSSINIEVTEYLINKGADVNLPSLNGLTALRVACLRDEIKLVELLIGYGANIFPELRVAFDNKEKLILHMLLKTISNINEMLRISCYFKETDIAYMLIKNGADIDLESNDQLNVPWLAECIDPSIALLLACCNDRINIIKVLIVLDANVNVYCEDKATPLMFASNKSSTDVVRLLVKNGANVNAVDSNGWNPLRWACHGHNTNTIEYLIKIGSNIETTFMSAMRENNLLVIDMLAKIVTNIDRLLAISCECEYGDVEVVNILLSYGANINRQDENKWTPLMRACKFEKKDISQLLVERGSTLNNDILVATTFLEESDLVKSLIEAGGGFYKLFIKSCKNNDTQIQNILLRFGGNIDKFLQLACCSNDYNAVHSIITSFDVDIDKCQNNGFTPLMTACWYSIDEIFQLLVNIGGANIFKSIYNAFIHKGSPFCKTLIGKCRNEDLVDSLFQASEMGYCEIMQLLIEGEVNVNQQNEAGDSPLIIACENEYQNLAKLLIDNGADTGEAFIMAFKNNDVYLTEFLIACGADLNKRDPIDWSPLTWACFIRQKHIENNRCVLTEFDGIIDLLISNGACANFALTKVCGNQYSTDKVSAIELLTYHGADINHTDENISTPLIIACSCATDEIFQLLIKVGEANIFKSLTNAIYIDGSPFCKIIIDKCRNEDLVDSLFQASEMGHCEIMQLLIEKKVNVNQQNEAGDSPLIIACENEYQNLAKLLIDNGADTGEAFIWAFNHKEINSTIFLIECGADVNKIGRFEWTPLTWACFIRQECITNNRCVSSKFERIVDLLISKGACANFSLTQVCGSQYGSEKVSSIELLIEKGADINYTDENGCKLLDLLERNDKAVCDKHRQLYERKEKKCIMM